MGRAMVGVVILAVALGGTAVVASAQPVPLRFGGGFAAEDNLWIMQARPELTPNQGRAYTLQVTRFRANLDRLNAFQAGQLDCGTVPSGTAILARAQGVKLKGVASLVIESPQGFSTSYLVLADAGINAVRDLRGKTIGIVDYKSATDLWARMALVKHGLDPDRDAKLVVVPFPAMGNALRTKKIDAGVFPQPFYAAEMQKGGVKLLFNAKEGVPYEEELLLIFCSETYLARQAQAVRAFLSDFVKATGYYLDRTRESRQAILEAKLVQIPAPLYLGLQDYARRRDARISSEAMEKQQELLVQLGWMEKERRIRMEELVDNSYLPR
ncbi:MAG: ABC transporter substrate-binding protein [Deltaproteobacteria bacterium]|nr:ABC transporter substrate-binding protein [Deltaproteobacteria bacterium]MBI3076126.1 ABC transporter substrate-binding protein [Deltaproteobacteria bacterium]